MRIHALQTGTVLVRERQRRGVGPEPVRRLRTVIDRRWTEALPIYAWLIEHPEGTIVVDTGEIARASEPGYFPRWHPYFRLAVRTQVRPEEELGPRLREHGVEPGDVRWVVLTHLHTDHAGGLGHVAGAEVVVSAEELSLGRGLMGQVRGYLPHRWPDGTRWSPLDFSRRPYGPFPASRPLTAAGDVHLVATPGHTPGHLSVVVEDGARRVILAGDVSYTEQLMLDGAVDGVAPNAKVAAETLARMRELVADGPAAYLPSHDPDSAARL
jgi:glyoxylase-like metal-dependent hydrolase (beta-lactamase superfamily II)